MSKIKCLRIIIVVSFAITVLMKNSIVHAATKETVSITKSNFSSSYIRQKLSKQYDKDKNGILNRKEINKIKNLKIQWDVVDLKGLSKLKKLEKLELDVELVKNIKEVSKLKNLKELDFSVTKIKKLDLKNNKKLTKLNVWGGKLKKINISSNSNLKHITLNKVNAIDVVDINKLKKLQKISLNNCTGKGKLTIKKLSYLRKVEDYGSEIRSLELKRCPRLKKIYLVNEEKIKEVRMKNLPSLISLEIYGCSMSDIIFKTTPKLKKIKANSVKKISKMDISSLKNIEEFWWIWGNLKELQLGENTQLTRLNIHHNQLNGTLDLTSFTKLSYLSCAYNELSRITGRDLKSLFHVECQNNKLEFVDLYNADALGVFNCINNPNVNVYVPVKGDDYDMEYYFDPTATIVARD